MLVRCFYNGLVGGLPFVARVALLACIGGLAFLVCVFGGGFLLWLLPACAFLTIVSLCNSYVLWNPRMGCPRALWCERNQQSTPCLM